MQYVPHYLRELNYKNIIDCIHKENCENRLICWEKISALETFIWWTSSLIELSADDFFGSRIEKSIVFTT